jgi:hypothetical protein
MSLLSFAINLAGASINATAFAVYHAPVSGACAILNGLLAVVALWSMEKADVRNSRF